MKKFFLSFFLGFWNLIFSLVKYLVTFILVLVIGSKMWIILLIWLGYGAYQTAAREWGWFAGIISILAAIVLPIITFGCWSVAFEENAKRKKEAEAKKRDEEKRKNEEKTATEKEKARQHQVSYLTLLASMMAKMSKADGHIDESEIRAAERAFVKLGLSEIQEQLCIFAFRNALHESYGIEHYATRMIELGFSYEVRLIAYEILWDIACADGILDQSEKAFLELLERWLKLSAGTFSRCYGQRVHASSDEESHYEQKQEPPHRKDSLSEAYDTLGCNPSATDEELKRAYRTLAKKFHPDILRAQGMPESFMKKANEHMARINAAWEEIKKARNIKS